MLYPFYIFEGSWLSLILLICSYYRQIDINDGTEGRRTGITYSFRGHSIFKKKLIDTYYTRFNLL